MYVTHNLINTSLFYFHPVFWTALNFTLSYLPLINIKIEYDIWVGIQIKTRWPQFFNITTDID